MATQVDIPPPPFQSAAKRRSSARQDVVADLLRSPEQLDVPLLHWLLCYPFQRVQDLALALDLTSATAYRRVAHQQQQGLVEHVTPASLGTGTCRLFYLSNLGLHVLAAREGVEPAALARTWGADERGLLRLLPRLPALMTLQTFLNSVIAGAPTALGRHDCPVLVRWHWVRDYYHQFVFREQVASLTADAALALRVSLVGQGAQNGRDTTDKWYVLLVLLDAGIGDMRLAGRRLDGLLCYRESPERWPVYASFPTLLVLVPTPHRAEQWQHVAAEMAERGTGPFAPLVGAIACVPLAAAAPIPWRMSWQALATGAPRRLADLLTPMPELGVPPGILDEAKLRATPSSSSRAPVLATEVSRPLQLVIRGDFARRAQLVVRGEPGQERGRRGGHVITVLLAPALNHRQWEVLNLLHDHPLFDAEEIAAALEVEVDSAERYLSLLRRSCCITEMLRTSSAARFSLSERGLRLVADAHHLAMRSILAYARRHVHGDQDLQRGVAMLLTHIDHTAGVYGFFATLMRAAQSERLGGRQHRLLWWETGSACTRRYRYHSCWHNLRPDGAGEYQADGRRLRFWLEWDRGTMGRRDLSEKLRAYVLYATSGEWGMEAATKLPRLLVVSADTESEARFARVAEATLGVEPELVVYLTTEHRMEAQGPLNAIWHRCCRTPGMASHAGRACLLVP